MFAILLVLVFAVDVWILNLVFIHLMINFSINAVFHTILRWVGRTKQVRTAMAKMTLKLSHDLDVLIGTRRVLYKRRI